VPIVTFSVATDVLAIICYLIIGLRLFRPIDRMAGPTWQEIRGPTLRFAGVAALNQIHSLAASQASRVVVGASIGVAAAGYYQIPYMLASRVNSMLQRAAYVVFPTASGMHAENDEEGVRRLYLRTSRLFFVANASVTMGICALAYPLLALWVSKDYAQQGSTALIIFSITSAVNAATMAASYVNLSALRPGVNLIFALSNSVITLATVYPLTMRYGVTGASLAGLLGTINVPVFFWYVHKHILHVPSRQVWRECYLPTVAANVPVGIAFYFLLAPHITSLIGALLALAVATLAGMVASGLLGAVKREDLRAGVDLVRGVLRRKRRAAPTHREPEETPESERTK
jgi:O-antigen/teichoic acid export membrane protein